jgi:DNA mismatch endonuclease (patch repair protein)
MADVFSKKKRSWVMSRIRSNNTILETAFLKKASRTFYADGYRYRKNCRTLPGKPDIAFHKQRVAVFIDGDFWHGYNFSKLSRKLPSTFWKNKIAGNIARDGKVSRELKKKGWRVVRFWEHEIEKNPAKAIKRIALVLKKRSANVKAK